MCERVGEKPRRFFSELLEHKRTLPRKQTHEAVFPRGVSAAIIFPRTAVVIGERETKGRKNLVTPWMTILDWRAADEEIV